ncbi:hypothetical protein Taro_053422 [Colocasia esculenta]|uniref:Uncharacterized protein n=1 Tax=Colocasia esculenta TaxID=4460 RepID=A0A843XMJ2_COLES|nr:hypothetical protein [Colocasia esculenta]
MGVPVVTPGRDKAAGCDKRIGPRPSRSRREGEEDELLVVVPQLLSHQELLHTTPSSFASALLEFLLLWLVRDWLSLLSLVREAHPPTLFRSMGDGATFGGSWRGSRRSGRYNGIRAQGSNEICSELITMAVPKKGTSTLLACLCRVAVR